MGRERQLLMRHIGRRVGVAAGLAAVMLAGGCGSLAAWSAPSPQVVVVGVDLNLSGRGAGGVVFDNALRLQAEQLRDQGQVPGGLELRVLDNRGDAASSIQNLRVLAADPQVMAIVTAGCPACVIELADELEVPLVSLDPVEAVAAPADQRRWVYRLGPNAGDVADVLSEAMTGTGVETVALVTVAGDLYGQEGARWVADAAQRDRLDVVIDQQITTEAASVTAAAATVAGWQAEPADPLLALPPAEQPAGPDAVVIWAPTPQAQQLATALRQAGYTGRLFLDMLAADTLYLGDDALQDATLVFTATPVADQRIAASPALAARQAWVRSYLARYGTYDMHSSWAADALLVVVDATGRAEPADRRSIRDRFESTRIDGLTGQVRFTGEQHSGLGPASLVTLTATGDRWQ